MEEMKSFIDIIKKLKVGDTLSSKHISALIAIEEYLSPSAPSGIEAWHDIFGTTQLTHASERLRIAEEKAAKYDKMKAAPSWDWEKEFDKTFPIKGKWPYGGNRNFGVKKLKAFIRSLLASSPKNIKWPEKRQVRYENSKKSMGLNGIIKIDEQNISYSKEDEAYNEAIDACQRAVAETRPSKGVRVLSVEEIEKAIRIVARKNK